VDDQQISIEALELANKIAVLLEGEVMAVCETALLALISQLGRKKGMPEDAVEEWLLQIIEFLNECDGFDESGESDEVTELN
jgi:hypothetical protein